MAIVTSLRAVRNGRVSIELDGAPWRVVQLEAVYRAGLVVGEELGRQRARALRREIRRYEALTAALGAMHRRDHTAASLAERLERRGVRAMERSEAVDALERAGIVDDVRFATARAETLARRGAGDLLIADDLERHGVDPAGARDAIDALEPESARAARLARARGLTPKTLRSLAAKGFSEASLEPLVADLEATALG